MRNHVGNCVFQLEGALAGDCVFHIALVSDEAYCQKADTLECLYSKNTWPSLAAPEESMRNHVGNCVFQLEGAQVIVCSKVSTSDTSCVVEKLSELE